MNVLGADLLEGPVLELDFRVGNLDRAVVVVSGACSASEDDRASLPASAEAGADEIASGRQLPLQCDAFGGERSLWTRARRPAALIGWPAKMPSALDDVVDLTCDGDPATPGGDASKRKRGPELDPRLVDHDLEPRSVLRTDPNLLERDRKKPRPNAPDLDLEVPAGAFDRSTPTNDRPDRQRARRDEHADPERQAHESTTSNDRLARKSQPYPFEPISQSLAKCSLPQLPPRRPRLVARRLARR